MGSLLACAYSLFITNISVVLEDGWYSVSGGEWTSMQALIFPEKQISFSDRPQKGKTFNLVYQLGFSADN